MSRKRSILAEPGSAENRLEPRLTALVLLVAFQLRAVIVGVPPVLPELRADLGLNFSATGALTSIPVLGLGLAAVPGALLVNRFGARRMVAVSIAAAGMAAILRVTPPVPYSIFAWTAVLALAIAVAQPALSVLVRTWFPEAIQRASTFYAMSLGLGGLAGATLSVYLLGLGGWRGSFIFWGALALVAAGAWIVLAPGRGEQHQPAPSGFARLVRDRAVWHVAFLFGSQSLAYYGAGTWIPFLLKGHGHGYLALVLFLFQFVGPPLSVLLIYLPGNWASSRRYYSAGGALIVTGSAALMLGLTSTAWLWAPLLGAGIGMIFAGATALPALYAERPADVAGYAALVLTAAYGFSFLGPLLGGVLLDHTRVQTSPFWVITASGLLAVVLGATLPKRALPDGAGRPPAIGAIEGP